MKDHRWRTALLLALFLAGGGAFFLWRTGFFAAVTVQEALDYIDRFSPYSQLVFFVVQLLSVILAPIPSNITAAAGAVLFGLWPAFLLTVAAVALGSLLVFSLSRTLGQSFADRFAGRKMLEKYLAVIRRKRDVFLALAFLFPFFPDDLLCILAGLSDLPLNQFFLLVLLFRPWGLLVACAVGSSAIVVSPVTMAILGLAGLVIFCLGLKYGDALQDWIMTKLK